MFNLELSLAEWRQQMLAAGIQNPVPLEELECHLRDEIEQLIKSGQSEAAAFQSAVQKIGPAPAVQIEFKKVEATREGRQWRAGQIWMGSLLGSLQLVLLGFVLFNSEMNFGERISGLAAMITSLVVVVFVRLSHRIFPVISSWSMRAALGLVLGGVPAGLWVLIFSRYFLVGHEFPFGHYLATLLWVNGPPLAFFLGLILGIETAARKKMSLAV